MLHKISVAALAALLGLLSVVYFFEWRAARSDSNRRADELRQGVRTLGQKLDLSSSRSAALLRSIQSGQKELAGLLKRLMSSPRREFSDQGEPEVDQVAGPSEVPYEDEAESISLDGENDSLPSLPDGMQPEFFLMKSLSVKSIVEDPRFNPDGKVLTRAERYRLKAILTRGRATAEVIEAEISAATFAGMETLREYGDYIEYAKGERYHVERGVHTGGEAVDDAGGIRMFYLYPEEYPEIYEAKRTKKKVAETAAREVVSFFKPQ